MMVVDLWFFSIVHLFNLSLTATKMVDVTKECNAEFYHIISQYSSNIVWWTSIFYCSCIFQLCCEDCMLGSCFDGKIIRVLYSQCDLQWSLWRLFQCMDPGFLSSSYSLLQSSLSYQLSYRLWWFFIHMFCCIGHALLCYANVHHTTWF